MLPAESQGSASFYIPAVFAVNIGSCVFFSFFKVQDVL